ncbi:MAG TPA: response regulator [Bryobacteraceae bacterium]|jgi:CheY-like chemotaxis protein|nr:response regulator [Bryobacteraceae bacterium]
MSRILLVDDSPHAQRMGERILADEGYEVVTVSNADSALIRLEDVDPDVVVADTVMPGRTGFDICHYLKLSPRHRHVRVILTAGVLENLDEEQAQRVSADSTLKKPFEASALLAAVKPLAEAAVAARKSEPGGQSGPGRTRDAAKMPAPFVAVVDSEQVRAAVSIALDAGMDNIVDEITRRVVAALTAKQPEPAGLESSVPPPVTTAMRPEDPLPAAPPPAAPRVETIRRITPVRVRPGSILGLSLTESRPSAPEPQAAPEAHPSDSK